MKYDDITGERFGRLTAVRRLDDPKSKWECVCDCGAKTQVLRCNLKAGRQKSCGCWRSERSTRHGMSATLLYKVWNSMLQRCHNPKNFASKDYGGRGITVCAAWHDFAAFYADVGDRPKGRTLERIDNDKGYEPGNVRWATMAEQHENTRSVNIYEHQGERMTLSAWGRHLGVSRELIRGRMRRGTPFGEVVSAILEESACHTTERQHTQGNRPPSE